MHGLTIEVHHRNLPDNTKLVLFKFLLSLYKLLKGFYISNKIERFSYKGGCDIHISNKQALHILCIPCIVTIITTVVIQYSTILNTNIP